jgi:hypothetical protein
MSDIVNNATIMITADASGVEAGLRKVDDATAKTGRNLDNLESSAKKTTAALEGVANTPGMETAGDGAGVAAGRMDRATKNMADSIQRTLATMNAGAKGSAQYYEALANSRGLNVNALRPYLDQLDEMTKKSALAADAQRKLDDSTRFLDSLRSRTEGIGKSASQLAALRAEQLGVSDAAAEMIQKLREQEEAGESSFGSMSDNAGKAKVALLAVAAAVAAAAVAGAALINEAIGDLGDLDDMAQKTGSSVESLSKIQKLATVFGADMGAVDSALTKLSKGMAGIDEDSSKTLKALKALGVESRDAAGNLRDPSEVLVDASKKLQGYNDSAAKTALVNDLLSKSGPDLLPFLNDLSENYDTITGTSGAAAAAAAGFQDKLGWAKLEVKGLVTSIAVDAVPMLNNLAGAFSDVYKEQVNLKKGDWSSWVDEIGLGFAKASDAVANFARYSGVAWDAFKALRAGFAVVDNVLTASPAERMVAFAKGGDGFADVKKSFADLQQAVNDGWEGVDKVNKGPTNSFEAAYLKRLNTPKATAAAPTAGGGGDLAYDSGAGAAKAESAAKKAAQEAAKVVAEYESLVDRINGKSVGIDADFYGNLAKLYTGYQAGKQSLQEYVDTVETYIGQQQFVKQAEDERLKSLEKYQKAYDAASTGAEKAGKDLQAQRDENDQIGLAKDALGELNATRIEGLALRAEERVWAAEGLDITGALAEEYRKEAAALRERAQAVREGAVKQVSFDAAKKAGEDLDKFLDPTKAQTFGDALKGAFGAAGDSMTQLVSALDAYGIRQAEVDKAREDASVKYAAGSKGLADATAAINAKEVKSRLSGYGDMAAAAKGFFAEGSKGYSVLSGAEKAYRAAELALALQAMTKKIFFKQGEVVANTALNATKLTGEAAASAASTGLAATEASAWGVTAVVKAIASLPFPLNLAAGAATLAAVVAIGAKMVGGIGGGSVALSEQRQKAQGTGSVLGSDEKSASIANSLDLIESATSKELNISTGMLASLRNIEAGIDQFASLLVRTTGVTGKFGADMGKNVFDSKAIGIGGAALGGIAGAAGGAYVGMGTSYIGAMLGGPVGMALGAVLGAVIGKTFIGKGLSKIFGGKQTVEDTGFTMGSASFGSIINGGVSASQYADIKKDGGWFRSDKKSTQLEGIGAEGNRQISTILTSLYDTVFEAGSLLGIGGDAFANQLNSFVVDIGKVSLKGKTGDQIQEELSAIFSKVGDDLASFSVAGITQFQRVGEGALETLARVAVNYASLDAVLASVGKTFGATGVASLGAREDLLTLAGGIDELASQTASFAENFLSESERLAPVQKYVTDQLASMGLSALRSRDSFKQYVLGLDLTNVAQREQYVALMDLQDAYAKLYPEIEDATKTLADARSELTDAYNAENDAISSTIDRMGSFAASLKSLRENALLGGLSPLSPQEKYAEAKAQYETVLAAARSGDESAQSNYSAAFNSFLTASRAVFASSGQYQADFAYAQASTAEAERWAGAQVDVGKAQLDALKLSVSGLITLDKSVLSVRDAILQMHQVMGPTAPPAPGAMAAPQINMPTPVMYASYGADNTVALVAELKSVRQELASLRAEQAVQTGHVIEANARSARESAEHVAGATTTGFKSVTNSEQRVALA